MTDIPVKLSEDDLLDVFGHLSCKYTLDGIELTLPGCISSSSTWVPMLVKSSVEIMNLFVSLTQVETLEFKYNVDPSRPLGQDSLKSPVMKEKTQVFKLYTSSFENVSKSGLYWIAHGEALSKTWEIYLEDLIVIL